METPQSSEHRIVQGRDLRAPSTHIRMDARRGVERIYKK